MIGRLRNIRNIRRLREIVAILIKYGFSDLLFKLNLAHWRPFRKVPGVEDGLTLPSRVRLVLEELGTTFIKVGQVASMRPDLVPAEFMYELEKLQNDVPAENYCAITSRIEEELGDRLDNIFVEFDREPLAAASLSQVHRGVLRSNGRSVAVKVRRPGITKKIKADLDLLSYFAGLVDERVEEYKVYSLPGLVEELRRSILNELDFTREARNMKIYRNLAGEQNKAWVPDVFENFVTPKVLTMELIQGVKVYDFQGTPEERRELARHGLGEVFRQIFKDGFFHADPHAGNVLITHDNYMCFIDWGMVGRLTNDVRRQLLGIVAAVIDADEERLIKRALRAFGHTVPRDISLLQRDVLDLMDTFYAQTTSQRSMGKFLLQFLSLTRTHRIPVPSQYAFMSRALLTMEGFGKELSPDLDSIKAVEPRVRRLFLEELRPNRIKHRLRGDLAGLLTSGESIPEKTSRLMDDLAHGRLTIRADHRGFDRLEKVILESSNKLTLGMVLAAVIIGSSLIITTKVGPTIFGLPAVGVVGYAISAMVGLSLVIDILRGRR